MACNGSYQVFLVCMCVCETAISPSLLMDNLNGYRIKHQWFCSFNTLVTYMISNGKSALMCRIKMTVHRVCAKCSPECKGSS